MNKVIADVANLVSQINAYRNTNKIEFYEPYEYQKKFHGALDSQGNPAVQRGLMAANQIGKMQPYSSIVKTPDGDKTMGEVIVGDRIFGCDGHPYNIAGVFENGVQPIYKVTFDDGVSTECGLEHLWKFIHPKDRFEFKESHGKTVRVSTHNEYQVGTLRDIIEIGGFEPGPERRIVIPVCSPVQYPIKELGLSPYILGVLIGDGGITNCVGLTSADADVVSRVKKELISGCRVIKRGKYQYFIIGSHRNPVKKILSELGLFGKKSPQKFIPDIYKYNSVQNRIDLLRGLMDTDGSIYGKCTIEFCSTSKRLADDVVWLVQSIGGKAYIKVKNPTYTHNGEKKNGLPAYQVRIRIQGINPFFLKRKADLFYNVERRPERILHKIAYARDENARCILIDSKEHTYLTDNFIVTHNTLCGGAETAIHATGIYPGWWTGHRFSKPVEWMVASTTNETTRDRCQKELFGEPTDDRVFGTGWVPLRLIGAPTRKPGVPNAYDSVLVKHISGGWSKLYFRAYEQGAKKFMGYRIDGGWGDEEPPADVWSQMLRGTFATGGILYITFTPEEGVTEVVHQFVNDLKPGQALIRAGWDDAPHMTKERQEQKMGAIPAHEREMRTRGVPLMGSGLVYPVLEDILTANNVQLQKHWPRIIGVDFGWEHAATLVSVAWDRDSDIIYIYDVWKQAKALIEIHALAVKSRGEWIPVAWPHDGLKHDTKSGKPMADLYRAMGVNMHMNPFSNPPSAGQKEGQGGNGVEVGVQEILSRMETGRFKVFSHLKEWFDEWRMYHRKDGQIVKLNDDLMDATRYAVMMRRHAITQPVRQRQQQSQAGMSNWG